MKAIFIHPADRQRVCMEAIRQKCVFYFCAQESGTLKFSHFVSVIFIYSRAKIEVLIFHRCFSCTALSAGFCHESDFAVACSSRKPKLCMSALKVWGKLEFKVGLELPDCSVSWVCLPLHMGVTIS